VKAYPFLPRPLRAARVAGGWLFCPHPLPPRPTTREKGNRRGARRCAQCSAPPRPLRAARVAGGWLFCPHPLPPVGVCGCRGAPPCAQCGATPPRPLRAARVAGSGSPRAGAGGAGRRERGQGEEKQKKRGRCPLYFSCEKILDISFFLWYHYFLYRMLIGLL
jgi:hypothetical protein